mmetsp:Transcript_30810/g.83464  ORF Transcript_30810/g.83464 Transcript_30810/m.83464 type:complete len:243 (+) Transcript_30810:129-857(+)
MLCQTTGSVLALVDVRQDEGARGHVPLADPQGSISVGKHGAVCAPQCNRANKLRADHLDAVHGGHPELLVNHDSLDVGWQGARRHCGGQFLTHELNSALPTAERARRVDGVDILHELVALPAQDVLADESAIAKQAGRNIHLHCVALCDRLVELVVHLDADLVVGGDQAVIGAEGVRGVAPVVNLGPDDTALFAVNDVTVHDHAIRGVDLQRLLGACQVEGCTGLPLTRRQVAEAGVFLPGG